MGRRKPARSLLAEEAVMQSQQLRVSREEMELISYFRGLPVPQQLDVLSIAEGHFNAFERMKALAMRHVESNPGEERHEWH